MNPQSTILGQARGAMNAGAPVLDQVSNTAPTAVPGMQPPSLPMPNQSPETALHRALKRRNMPIPPQMQMSANPPPSQVTLPVQDMNPTEPGVQVPASEAELIIKALSKHLDHKNKMEEKVMNAAFPKVGPESIDALGQMGNKMDNNQPVSIEDMNVLDKTAGEQLRIPPKIMAGMTPQQKLAELMGVLQQPKG